MPDLPQKIYWDACVFLAYVNDQPERVDIVNALLERSAANEIEIFTSDLSRVEVAFSATEQQRMALDEQAAAQIDNLWDDQVVRMVDFHVGITKIARDLMRWAITKGRSLKPADAIHLGTAQWLCENGIAIDEFHTFEDGLDKFAAEVSFKICRPYTPKPRLL